MLFTLLIQDCIHSLSYCSLNIYLTPPSFVNLVTFLLNTWTKSITSKIINRCHKIIGHVLAIGLIVFDSASCVSFLMPGAGLNKKTSGKFCSCDCLPKSHHHPFCLPKRSFVQQWCAKSQKTNLDLAKPGLEVPFPIATDWFWVLTWPSCEWWDTGKMSL